MVTDWATKIERMQTIKILINVFDQNDKETNEFAFVKKRAMNLFNMYSPGGYPILNDKEYLDLYNEARRAYRSVNPATT